MKLENEIRIAAPPADVWDVTIDVERWPEWTPTVKRIRRLGDGPLDVGGAVEILQPGMPAVRWEITEFDAPRRFTWTGRLRGLRMVATHALAADGDGTRNTLEIEMGGVVAVLLGPLIRWSVARALARENAGLKARCESAVAAVDD